jgi:hypothetical protein
VISHILQESNSDSFVGSVMLHELATLMIGSDK